MGRGETMNKKIALKKTIWKVLREGMKLGILTVFLAFLMLPRR